MHPWFLLAGCTAGEFVVSVRPVHCQTPFANLIDCLAESYCLSLVALPVR